jgi:hypothetical protein
MTIETINIGNYANDGTGDDLRTAFEKVNANFTLLDGRDVTAGTNLGTGEQVFKQKTGSTFQFRSLVAGSNITLSSNGTSIVINGVGNLEEETSPALGGDLDLNGYNIVGTGDIQATVYGIDIRELAASFGNIDYGSFNNPTFGADFGTFI